MFTVGQNGNKIIETSKCVFHIKFFEFSILQKTQKQIPDTMPFPCDTNGSRSLIRPTNVHRVRPGDIDVIGALGDSLTAANGAFGTSIFQVDVENRGVSFATGN